jgi:hypothetical protein
MSKAIYPSYHLAEINKMIKEWINLRRIRPTCPMPQPLRTLLQCLHLDVREWLETETGHTFTMPRIDDDLIHNFIRLFKHYRLGIKSTGERRQRVVKLSRVHLASLTLE